MQDTGEHAGLITRNARYGLVLFAIYVVLYGGFIYLAVFQPATMAQAILGVNVAIAYGFFLILSAFLLALVYLALCGRTMDDAGTPQP